MKQHPTFSEMGEQPIYSTRAHVFQIDPSTKKKWLPSSSQAISVGYFYDSSRNTYRIISVDGSKAVINSTITPNMTFTKTSVKFGQWSDPRANTVYGLGFATEGELTQFIEKFKEVKDMTRLVSMQAADKKNGSISPTLQGLSVENEQVSLEEDLHCCNPENIPAVPAIPTVSQNESTNDERKDPVSGESSSVSSNQVIEQLKYENDRLKIALAQSSANAKKWEVELQTLKNNNARLTTALQESTSNVEQWKKQLAAYKEENAKLKKQAFEMDRTELSTGREVMEFQLADMREKMSDIETNALEKQEMLKSENNSLQMELTKLKKTIEDTRKNKHQVQELQGEICSKTTELLDLNDRLTEILK